MIPIEQLPAGTRIVVRLGQRIRSWLLVLGFSSFPLSWTTKSRRGAILCDVLPCREEEPAELLSCFSRDSQREAGNGAARYTVLPLPLQCSSQPATRRSHSHQGGSWTWSCRGSSWGNSTYISYLLPVAKGLIQTLPFKNCRHGSGSVFSIQNQKHIFFLTQSPPRAAVQSPANPRMATPGSVFFARLIHRCFIVFYSAMATSA